MISIDDDKPPFICDVLYNLETDFTPERRQAGSSNPIFSSTGCSVGRKNNFLEIWPNYLSSLLQGIPNGRPVIALVSSGVSSRVKPIKLSVACSFDCVLREIKNSLVISSS